MEVEFKLSHAFLKQSIELQTSITSVGGNLNSLPRFCHPGSTAIRGDANAAFVYLIGLRETIRLSGNVKCFCHEVYSHVVPNSESFGNLSFPSSCSLFGLTLPSPHPLLTSARHLSPGRPCVCCLVCPDVPSSETTLVSCCF